ncbi:MAG TPA: TolC family protein [Verrucomicrobia bacterium]|nr:TolC family protein [Verrucomicrobiota bacterium]
MIPNWLKKHLRVRQMPFSALIVGLLFTSCSTSYYHKQADKEVYGIIEQVEKQIFGESSGFNVNTGYSERDAKEILLEEIILDRHSTNVISLTIEQALDMAVKNSREYQNQKEQLYLTSLSLTGSRFRFGPQFFGNTTGELNRSSDGERSGNVNSRVGVSQALKSGANIGASIANDLLRFYTGSPRESAISTLSLNLFQPLLRGAGKSVVAENLKQAERNVIYAVRSFSQFQRDFIIGVVLDYYGLLQDKDRLRNSYQNYLRRVELIARTEARGNAGLEQQLNVDDVKSSELDAKNSYINIIATYLANLDRFKLNTLSIPLGTKLHLDDTALKDLSKIELKSITLNNDEAFSLALNHHLDLLNDIDRFEDSKRQLVVAANQLKPGLNIFGDASLRSDEPTDYTNFDFNEIRAGVGIELDLPLNRLNERNDYRATRVRFESDIRSLALALDRKRNEIDQGKRDLEQARRNYSIQNTAYGLAERRVTGEEMGLQAGISEVRDVREAQDALILAQNDVTDALISYLTARLNLFVNMGILDTNQEKFWLRSDSLTVDLAGLAEDGRVIIPVDEVIPPEDIFLR